MASKTTGVLGQALGGPKISGVSSAETGILFVAVPEHVALLTETRSVVAGAFAKNVISFVVAPAVITPPSIDHAYCAPADGGTLAFAADALQIRSGAVIDGRVAIAVVAVECTEQIVAGHGSMVATTSSPTLPEFPGTKVIELVPLPLTIEPFDTVQRYVTVSNAGTLATVVVLAQTVAGMLIGAERIGMTIWAEKVLQLDVAFMRNVTLPDEPTTNPILQLHSLDDPLGRQPMNSIFSNVPLSMLQEGGPATSKSCATTKFPREFGATTPDGDAK